MQEQKWKFYLKKKESVEIIKVLGLIKKIYFKKWRKKLKPLLYIKKSDQTRNYFYNKYNIMN